MKRLCMLIMAIMIALAVAIPAGACTNKGSEVTVYVPDGATAISLAYMMKNVKEIDGRKIKYSVVPASMIGGLVSGEDADIAIMPVNQAANTMDFGYSLAAITSHGNLYLMSNQQSGITAAELSGKTVGMFGSGQIPGLVFEYILKKNGLNTSQSSSLVSLEYMAGFPLVSNLLLEGEIEFGLLPEPSVSAILGSSGGSIKIALDIQAEFQRLLVEDGLAEGNVLRQTSGYPQAGMVVKNSLDKAFFNEFLAILMQNNDFAQNNASEVPAIIAENMYDNTESSVKSLNKDAVLRSNATVFNQNLKEVITQFFTLLGLNTPPDSFFYTA